MNDNHPIYNFVGRTIEQVFDDGGNFVIKFTDGRYGTIHMNFPADSKEISDIYWSDFKNKRLYVVAGLYPEDFVPNVCE